MKSTKSQASLEFMMVFGISFTILVVLGSIFFMYMNSEKNTLDNQYMQKIALEMMGNIEKVYFLGEGNRVTTQVKFPEGVENISIRHYTNHLLPDGNLTSFDVLNITTVSDSGDSISNIHTPTENYIRFNCTSCIHVGDYSWYNNSETSAGPKKIRFESKGDYVAVSFPKD